MNLTIEHLAKRLPYGLKSLCPWDGKIREITISNCESIFIYSKLGIGKPILRNLSDLTKEIEHNGERLRVSDLIDNGRWQNWIYNHSKITKDKLLDCPQWIMDIFLKYHFDVDFLIELGNAIDVNTLEVNPYK